MPELFTCPSCTGRLEYAGGQQLTVQCPFCGNTVIVPESLRRSAASGTANIGSEPALQEILDRINAGQKIEAIKRFREVYGVGLKEAKEAVEALEAGTGVATSLARSAQVSTISGTRATGRVGLGCVLVSVLLIAAIAIAAILVVFPLLRQERTTVERLQSADGAPAAATAFAGIAAPLATALPAETVADPVVLRFGSRGIAPGQFNDPRAIALGADGTLFVADYQGGRVQLFDDAGSYQTTWELDPEQVIKSMSADRNNNLYVVQASELRRYDQTSGELLGALSYQSNTLTSFSSVATATNGDVVATNHFGELVRFDGSGNLLQLVPIEDVAGAVSFGEVAVDGAGNVYMLGTYEDALGDRHEGVFIFNNQGQYVQRFGQSGDAPGEFTSPGAIAVDGQGRIYVSDFPGILIFANSGSYLTTLPDEGFVFGMAVNAGGELLATGNANQVVKYAAVE